MISKILNEYLIISFFLFLKNGGTNSIILFIVSLEFNKVEEDLNI